MGMRKGVPHAKCSPLCAIKEKLQALWDRTYGCINKINDITPDGDGKFTIQGGQNISITPISNGLAFDANYPSGVLTINGQTPDADGDISGIATTAQLGDGSVTKVGTANVGTDTKPIKLVGGVPTAVTNDLVDVSSAQTISSKTFNQNIPIKLPTASGAAGAGEYKELEFVDQGDIIRTNVRCQVGSASTIAQLTARKFDGTDPAAFSIVKPQTGDAYATVPYRAYNSANVNDVVTIGSLASNPSVIHATGNEIKTGNFTVGGYTYTPGTYQTSNQLKTRIGSNDEVTSRMWTVHDASDAISTAIVTKDAQNKEVVLRIVSNPNNNTSELILITRNGTWHTIATFTD